MNSTPIATSPPLDLTESAAGEEDPGAGMDLPERPQAPKSPGDEAPPGTPGTGEDVCLRCGGSGKLAGRDCPMCQGSGKVTAGIGGA